MNSNDDSLNRNIVDFLEIVNRAINDSIRPARHILLGGGTPNSPDMGAREIAEITKAIKSNHDVSVYAMIAAPLENASIDILHDSGVDELGINLEFWSEEAWSNLIPGKNKIIGKKRYLEAISHLGKVFGRVRSRSIMVAGLESASETLNGVKHLVDAGVMPILSPFRALSGTIMERAEGFSSREYQILYVEAARIAAKAALPIGPACIPCMNNVLALPEDDPCSVKQQLE
jgi:hypothetical protein